MTRDRIRASVAMLAATCALAFIAWTPAQDPGRIELIFLDVGQGDALIVRSPEGNVALIDAGRGWLIGQLGAHGIDSIDVAIATHPHADHIGGMVDVLHDLPVKTYIDNGVPHTTAIYAQVMSALEASDAVYVDVSKATTPNATGVDTDSTDTGRALTPLRQTLGSVELEILRPRPDSGSLNDRSLGVLIRYGEFTALVTGDAEVDGLNYFLELGMPRITVLKASHHGARNGVTPAFLSATRPKAVVISVGEDNGYGHPHAWALEYYKTVADETYRTDMHGEVRIVGALDGAYEVRTVWGDRFARAGDNPKLNEDISDDATHVDVWVYPDALGYDQFNLNGEYAVIKNNSTATMTIAAWQLCNVERRCYTFPPGAAIAAHDSVFVHSGVGHTQSHKFYMRQTQPVWDDNTGRATLIDENGRVVARYAY